MRALVLALLAMLLLAPATAGAVLPRASFNDVEDEVMCDTCNVPLNVADSDRADQERATIRKLIAKGLTKDQIKAELKKTYGPAILATPQDSGFSLAVWWVPVVLVIAVVGLLVALLPRWRRRARADEAAALATAPALSEDDARRLNEDLARYDG